MLKAHRWLVAAASIAAVSAPAAAQPGNAGALYGRVTTLRGEVHEGFIRWDRNEGHWADLLDGSRQVAIRHLREAADLGGARAPGRRRVDVLGLRFTMNREPSWRSSGVRLGHVARITVLDERHGLITMKSGEQIEFRGNSTDVGQSNDGIVVASGDQETTLRWNRIDFIEFTEAPGGEPSPFGSRIYGTLETESGDRFEGWITWDMDEIYARDELDGDVGGRRRSLAMGDLASITAASNAAAEVTLKNGETMTLRGTNDVNSGNRGIAVGDPGLGQVRVDWQNLRAVRFSDPPARAPAFDGGRRIAGTVTTADGTEYSGAIRWDNDEAWTWELLDGNADGMEFKIEFGMIARIERESSRTSLVTLRDGRSFTLGGSNDVDGDNNGIIVEVAEDDAVLVRWEDVSSVTFR